MNNLPNCPKCDSSYAYADGTLFICPKCANEWTQETPGDETDQTRVDRDAHGNVLSDGVTVTVIKDLKVKGSSAVIKVGTQVRGIRLVDKGSRGLI